jgi:hypothetical protein
MLKIPIRVQWRNIKKLNKIKSSLIPTFPTKKTKKKKPIAASKRKKIIRKPWQTPLNKTPSKGGKKDQRERERERERTQAGSQKRGSRKENYHVASYRVRHRATDWLPVGWWGLWSVWSSDRVRTENCPPFCLASRQLRNRLHNRLHSADMSLRHGLHGSTLLSLLLPHKRPTL